MFLGINRKHNSILTLYLVRFLVFIPLRYAFLYVSDICLKTFLILAM